MRNRERRRNRHIEILRERLAELDAELDASGVDDALDWERWDEMERVLYALAERELAAEWAAAREVAERDELIELAEMAEEAAQTELAVFGNVEWEFDERIIDGDELEGFWEFACDLYDEPKPHCWVLDELY
jgi:hypothetical protein